MIEARVWRVEPGVELYDVTVGGVLVGPGCMPPEDVEGVLRDVEYDEDCSVKIVVDERRATLATRSG